MQLCLTFVASSRHFPNSLHSRSHQSDAFQDDIFPDTCSAVPAHSADEWLAGSSKAPNKMSLDPMKAGEGGGSAPKRRFRTMTVVTKELEEAQKRIDYLEEKLKTAGIDFE